MRSRDLGGVRFDAVWDGTATMTVGEAFGERAAHLLAEHPGAFTASGDFEFPIGAYLVRTADRVVLIDAGAGPRDTWVRSGHLLESLAELGVQPADVTDVVLTHLHWDHIGWVSQKGVPVFVNATLHCHRADWDHFYEQQVGATKRLAPVADSVRTWTDDGEIVPGVEVVHTPGHTPGSSIVIVTGTESGVGLLGDVVHCPFQLSAPEIGFTSDHDPELAARSRERAVSLLRDRRVEATAAHFPGMRLGPVDEKEQAWT